MPGGLWSLPWEIVRRGWGGSSELSCPVRGLWDSCKQKGTSRDRLSDCGKYVCMSGPGREEERPTKAVAPQSQLVAEGGKGHCRDLGGLCESELLTWVGQPREHSALGGVGIWVCPLRGREPGPGGKVP